MDITINPVFGALTRPPMTWGVTYEFHAMNLMVSMTGMIGLGSILYLSLFIPLHALGWAVCRYDVHCFRMVHRKLAFLPNHPNHALWGVRCYEPF